MELNAFIGQRHAASAPMQQLAADEIFKLADMATDGALADK
jgi:hypothetical protein